MVDSSTSTPAHRLAEAVLAGDRRALARAISIVENDVALAEPMMRHLFPTTGQAFVVGITGPPGAGKSTLVDALVRELRRAGESVGVIAVDPSSPFSGGAVLGDRVRMTRHSEDAGVFVRSMATRGHLGGLSRATGDAALLLDAAGLSVILIETVGVGQDEVDIVRTADTSVVVLVPGTGDDIQALKAGIMEIADIFVVNKADRDGADHLVQTIRAALTLGESAARANVPVLKTAAASGEGVAELWRLLAERRSGDNSARSVRQRTREESRVRELVVSKLRASLDRAVSREQMDQLVTDLVARRVDPYTAADSLLELAQAGSRR